MHVLLSFTSPAEVRAKIQFVLVLRRRLGLLYLSASLIHHTSPSPLPLAVLPVTPVATLPPEFRTKMPAIYYPSPDFTTPRPTLLPLARPLAYNTVTIQRTDVVVVGFCQ
ncbi:hypothetical protein C8R47DRAFT_1218177 [Mycena vitilis]|nr:hypothetical protein C8R47DRAFT_1218177 [Mycena vitilis]